MSLYLNQGSLKFESYFNDDIFIDKSLLIEVSNKNLNKESSKYMCVTRPRRFGKTMALSMLNAYYSKGCNSADLFKNLNISKDESYLKHLNKHNVIWIDMAKVYLLYKDKFIENLTLDILDDINEIWPNVLKKRDTSIASALL